MRLKSLAAEFARRYGAACQTLARAPGRVNLIGEHTDYNDGFVLPMAIQQSTWVAVAPRADGLIRVQSRQYEDSPEWPAGRWSPAAFPRWTAYVAGVAELLRRRNARLGGFDMLIDSNVPLGGGLSSSAALEVSAATALAELCDETLAKSELADLCRQAEHEFARVPCGIMDQYIAVHGQAGAALLLDCRARTFEVIPLELDGHTVIIVNSGVRRELANGEYSRRHEHCRRAVEHFREMDSTVSSLRDVDPEMVRAQAGRMEPAAYACALHVATENQRTLAAADALKRGDLASLGPLLAASHASLRDDYDVSCEQLDQLVEIAAAVPGVVGARMTGGGFGGCIVVIVRSDAVADLTDRIEREYSAVGPHRAAVLETHPGPGAEIVTIC